MFSTTNTPCVNAQNRCCMLMAIIFVPKIPFNRQVTEPKVSALRASITIAVLISSSALNTSRLIGSTRMLELCSSVNNITWQLAFSKLATLHVVQREQSPSSILIRRSNVLTYTHMNPRADSASLRNIKYSPSTPHAHSQEFICA